MRRHPSQRRQVDHSFLKADSVPLPVEVRHERALQDCWGRAAGDPELIYVGKPSASRGRCTYRCQRMSEMVTSSPRSRSILWRSFSAFRASRTSATLRGGRPGVCIWSRFVESEGVGAAW